MSKRCLISQHICTPVKCQTMKTSPLNSLHTCNPISIVAWKWKITRLGNNLYESSHVHSLFAPSQEETEAVVSMETVAGQWWVFAAWTYDTLPFEGKLDPGRSKIKRKKFTQHKYVCPLNELTMVSASLLKYQTQSFTCSIYILKYK